MGLKRTKGFENYIICILTVNYYLFNVFCNLVATIIVAEEDLQESTLFILQCGNGVKQE